MTDRARILARYAVVRSNTDEICAPLQIEDFVVQPMADVSPPRWHIAHVTWFFEQFVLTRFVEGYEPFHPQFAFLFNSYYNHVGERTERSRRGMLTRPTVQEIWVYRKEIDARITQLIEHCDDATLAELLPILEVGLNHEQQHQELLVTDIKYILFQPPLYPAYQPAEKADAKRLQSTGGWQQFDGGVFGMGHESDGFAFDNELPRHDQLLRPFRLANDLVSNAQYLEFMRAGGYTRPEFWLSDGWDVLQREAWCAPLYWLERENVWYAYTQHGLQLLDEDEPVMHLSYYEADAYARWVGKRLPTEFEWEHAAPTLGNPVLVWDWTCSGFLPYPV
jgi:ergothioneine biosynthesis protein EgtB